MESIESLITASMAGVALLALLLFFGFAALCVRKAATARQLPTRQGALA